MSKKPKLYNHAGFAGCVARFTSRATKRRMGIYHAGQAGMESDPRTPWAVVCEEHGTLVCTETLALARSVRSGLEFCDMCRDREDPTAAAEPEYGLGYMQGRGAS